MTLAHPILQYPGAKWTIAGDILPYFPKHRTYTEVFGGSAALLLNKEPSFLEVYNDISLELTNLFRQLQNRETMEVMKHRLTYTPYSREECAYAFEATEDKVEAACRLIIRGYMARTLQRNHFRRPSVHSWGSKTDTWREIPSVVEEVCERLRNVVIENIPAIDCLRLYDSESTLHYLDPPYIASTRKKNLYQHELHEDTEHRELLEVVLGLKGMCILSGYANSLYDEMLAGWRQVKIKTFADGGGVREEILYLSPNIPMARQTTFL